MKFLSKNKISSAFTLTEILVVITIIIILVGIVIISTEGSRALARDKKRMSDFAGYQVALQEYYSKNKSYHALTLPPSEESCEAWKGKDENGKAICNYVVDEDKKSNPACDCLAVEALTILKTEGFLENLPKDPKNTETYIYRYISYNGGKDYKMYVPLEKDEQAMKNDGGSYPSAENQTTNYYEIFSALGSGLAINYWKVIGVGGAPLSCNICKVPLGTCTGVSNDCDTGKKTVLHLSASTNAHAEFKDQNKYGCGIECSGPTDFSIALKTVAETCSSGNKNTILRLSANVNAHVGNATSVYENKICLERISGAATCRTISSGDCDSGTGETCVATISSDGNAHVGGCGAYSKKICCTTFK